MLTPDPQPLDREPPGHRPPDQQPPDQQRPPDSEPLAPRAAASEPTRRSPLVSVVVCTYNRAEMLEPAVASLLTLRTGGDEPFQYEVLIVDNASTDDTPEVAARMAAKDRRVRSVREPMQGVSAARNCGLQQAAGEWIAFFDDDQLADPAWLQELLGAARRHGSDLVGGRVDLQLPDGCDRQLWPEPRQLLGEQGALPEDTPYGRRFAPGAGNLMIRRSLLAEIGGFNLDYDAGGEDTELFRRLGERGVNGWCAPRAVVFHCIPAVRLEDKYMRWSALREGSILAQMEREEGWPRFARWIAIRFGQGLLKFLPRWAWARIRGDREAVLAARCLLWRIRGYLGKSCGLLLGRGRLPASLRFREGREQLVG